jgi:UDP-N-acetyl-D-mannosaminuronic acid dehydrogenase
MLVNEGLPNFLVRHVKRRYPLAIMTVGILGMAFKGDSDDPRESLSYKLRKVLEYEAGAVLCSDPHVADPSLRPLDDVLEHSELLFIGAPHRAYRDIKVPIGVPVVDVWNLLGRGAFPA